MQIRQIQANMPRYHRSSSSLSATASKRSASDEGSSVNKDNLVSDMIRYFVSNHFWQDTQIRHIQAKMTNIHCSSSSPSAITSLKRASGAVALANEDSLVSDIIRYILQHIFDKIRKFARFEQICLVFKVYQVPLQKPHLREARLMRLTQWTRRVWKVTSYCIDFIIRMTSYVNSPDASK